MSDPIQVIVMTSDKSGGVLQGFFDQWFKYAFGFEHEIFVCGYSSKHFDDLQFHGSQNVDFYEIGNFSHYPASKWSDSLIRVLDDVARELFILMLDDYWLVRQVDSSAIKIIDGYMRQFENVVRFDLTTDRLYADPGKYVYGYNTYNVAGHLDLIKSDFHSSYHLSLWGAMWRRELLYDLLELGESAQQIELNGTRRLSQKGDELLVLGTRQSPMRHANVIQGGVWNQSETVGLPALSQADRERLQYEGAL